MRELTFMGSKTLKWRDVPEPALKSESDALVRPFIAARCDGDAVFLRHDFDRPLSVGALLHLVDEDFRRPATNPFAGPFAYGHECVAQVTACGVNVTRFAIGDIVIVPWAISCGRCAPCGSGFRSKCAPALGDKPLAAYGFSGAIGGHGGMVSDLLRVPWADEMLLRVPAGVDPVSVASASDNIPDAYQALELKLTPQQSAALDALTQPKLNFPAEFLELSRMLHAGGTTVNGQPAQLLPFGVTKKGDHY
jgi:threonine dehydrogenase-like Zn-dependent dehydrogenase